MRRLVVARRFNDAGEPIYGEKDEVDLEKAQGLWNCRFGWRVGSVAPGVYGKRWNSGLRGFKWEPPLPTVMNRAWTQICVSLSSTQCAAAKSKSARMPRLPQPVFRSRLWNCREPHPIRQTLAARKRVCDLGMLRQIYEKDDGTLGYRCPAEPVAAYEKKGGRREDTEGVLCLCNCLGATAGYPQHRSDGYLEPTLVTSGDGLIEIVRFLPAGATHYSAEDVLRAILDVSDGTNIANHQAADQGRSSHAA